MKTDAKTDAYALQHQVSMKFGPNLTAWRTDARAVPWRPSATVARVYFKDLASAAGWSFQLVRYDAGGTLSIDAAARPLFLYVVEGELILCDERLWPGAVVATPDGIEPAPSRSEVGCTLLVLSKWPLG